MNKGTENREGRKEGGREKEWERRVWEVTHPHKFLKAGAYDETLCLLVLWLSLVLKCSTVHFVYSGGTAKLG